MAKIIFEDIKLNKKPKQVLVPKEEVRFVSSTEIKNEIEKARAKAKIEEVEQIKVEKDKKINFPSSQRLTSTPRVKTKNKIISNFTLVLFLFVIIFGVFFLGSNYFQKANITITTKHQSINYKNKQFTASKDSGSTDFEIMINTDEKSKTLILTEPKDVTAKAQGSVTFYNEFSQNPQKLQVGTFLADENGKTYKTDSSVNIPGYKLDISKKIVPGQIKVSITAFLPGETYNGSPSDFYITSFKGTIKYKKIYAKLDKELTGGISGLVYVMNDEDKMRINNTAETEFRDDLIKKVEALVPPGYILYPNAMNFSYQTEGEVTSKTPEAEIKMKGTLAVLLLKEKSLVDNILKISLPEVKGEELKEINILALNKLTFNFVNKDQPIDKDINSIPFFLTGDTEAVWSPDTELLKTKLVGIPKTEVLNVFRKDPGIAGAIVKIFPPWNKYIPNEPSKINIILK